METSRILGALQATWHDLYETNVLHGFHTRRSAHRHVRCGVAGAGRVAASRIGGLLRNSPSVFEAYCYPSSSWGEGKERENVRIAVVTRRSEQSATKCQGSHWRFSFQDAGQYSGLVGQRANSLGTHLCSQP